MFSRLATKKYVAKELPIILKDYWDKFDEKRKGEMIEEVTILLEKEVEEFQNTLFEADNKRSDLVFYFFGIFVGILGNLVANIIQSFLGRFGALYYGFSFVIFILILVLLFYLARENISKINRRNKNMKPFLEYIKNKRF